jgi:thiol-disulfide isomerase/thioredoxin
VATQKLNDNIVMLFSALRLALDDPAAQAANAKIISVGGPLAARAKLIRAMADYLQAEQDPTAQSAAIDRCRLAIDSGGADGPSMPIGGIFIKNPPANQAIADQVPTLYKNQSSDPIVPIFLSNLATPDKLSKLHEIRMTHGPLVWIEMPSDQTKILLQHVGLLITLEGALIDGSQFSTAKWKGEVILVDFWATWCGPCVQELPDYAKLYAKYHEKGLEMLSISSDESAAPLTAFLSRNPSISWPQILDSNLPGGQSIVAMYSVSTYPTKFIIDRKGVLRQVFVGSSPDNETKIGNLIDQMIAEKP